MQSRLHFVYSDGELDFFEIRGLFGPFFVVMASNAIEKSVSELVRPLVTQEGCELVDVELTTENNMRVLRVSVDRDGGVMLEDLSRVSAAIEDVIDVNDCVPGRYHLEVSSPGLDRPLRSRQHFEAVLGKVVRLATTDKIDGRQNFKGMLREIVGEDLSIDIDNQVYRIPLGLVKKARLVF